MAGVIFLSLPYMFFKNEHIIVDLFPVFKKGYLGWILGLIFLAIGSYSLWIIGDKTFSLAMRSLEDGDTYEYIIAPSFLAKENSEFLPKVYIDTFIALSIYFTVLMIILRFILVLFKNGLCAFLHPQRTLRGRTFSEVLKWILLSFFNSDNLFGLFKISGVLILSEILNLFIGLLPKL